MTPTTFSSDFSHPSRPLMLDAAGRSVQRGLAREARGSGTMFAEVGGRDGRVRRTLRPAGPSAYLRSVRERLTDSARRLLDADER